MTKRFYITKPALKYHYNIVEESTGTTYFTQLRVKPSSTLPRIVLYPGSAIGPTVLAAGHMPAFSETFQVAFGDPESDSVEWQALKKTKVSKYEYRWSTNLAASGNIWELQQQAVASSTYCTFVWKRTGHVGVEGAKMNSWSPRNWKLMVEGETELLAVFTADSGMNTNCGVLEIRVDRGEDFDTKVLFTLLCMYYRSQS